MKSFRSLILYFILFCSSFSARSSLADPVYRSTDQKGVTVYTSKPREKGAEPAKLPTIAKVSIGAVTPINITCVTHGGINCQSGADSDGSVICYDNFKDSIQRFAMSCSAAKLIIIPESQKSGLQEFSLVVRNSSAVLAKGIKVSGPKDLVLEGPVELEPYGSASYAFKGEIARNARFQVSCDNCP